MGNELNPAPGMGAIMRALDRKKQQDAEREAREQRYEAESRVSKMQRASFLEHCQPATLLEYTAWMIGYLHRGGEPDHVYDYDFGGSNWWVLAEAPDSIPSLYGSDSVNIIVPKGVQLAPQGLPRTFHGNCGHSTFYFMDGFVFEGTSAPVYANMLPALAARL